jgi:uncharacterized protein (TIGR02452 family)
MAYTGTRNNDRKNARADEARAHIAEMDARFKSDIARSLAELKVYEGSPKTTAEGCMPQVTVVDQDSVAAVLERGRGLGSACDLALLDFASFINPGGGYERGAWAQEEAICAESTLYNVLREQRSWYNDNRRRNINCELYRNRGLVAPKIRFERDGYHSYADVIVVAAPFAKRAKDTYNVKDGAMRAAMRERIRFVLAIADDLGHKKLVLGAFGCGVFGWDASVVARMFLEELATGTHVAEQVVFAIPHARFDENLAKFQHAFAKFPEANDASYAKPVEKPVETKADEDDDEDEDDWRKYL